MKPWLLEINASPSLSTTTKTDKELKMNLINEVYKIVMPNDDFDSEAKSIFYIPNCERYPGK